MLGWGKKRIFALRGGGSSVVMGELSLRWGKCSLWWGKSSQ